MSEVTQINWDSALSSLTRSPRSIMLRNKSRGLSSLQHCQHLGPGEMPRDSGNRPLVHTHNESHFWQNIRGCQESWSRMGWASKERRNRKKSCIMALKKNILLKTKDTQLTLLCLWLWSLISGSRGPILSMLPDP